MPSTNTDDVVDSLTSSEPLYLEDLQTGDCWHSDWRTITADDVAEFAALTGDDDPLHTDQIGPSPFGRPVAHGLLGLSVLAGLSTERPNTATLALIGINDWTFDHPVFFDDQVQVLTEVELIEPHGRRAGRVTWRRKLVNQDGRVVQQGQLITLVARRVRAPRRDQFADAKPATRVTAR